jgi:hypothetical protein
MYLNCGHQRAYCSSPTWCTSREQRWNDSDREFLIRPSELSGNPTSRLNQYQIRRDWWMKLWILLHEVSLLYFEGIFNVLLSLTTWSRRLYFPSEWRRAADFLSPLKIHRPRPCLNSRTLCPKTSTLTARSSRTTANQNHCTHFPPYMFKYRSRKRGVDVRIRVSHTWNKRLGARNRTKGRN